MPTSARDTPVDTLGDVHDSARDTPTDTLGDVHDSVRDDGRYVDYGYVVGDYIEGQPWTIPD